MKLKESKQSNINDEKMFDEMLDVIYKGTDNRPAWIGAYRPATTIEKLKPQARWASEHYDFYLSFIRDFVYKAGSILDIGCGAGQNTAMLARYGSSAVGIDNDPKAIAFATKHNTETGAQFILGKFPDDMDPDTSGFDYIFTIETMEHIPYKEQLHFLDSALSLLKENGMMFITTPNEETPFPPHIGIWSSQWISQIQTHLTERIMRQGYFNNKTPADGILDTESSHHAMVLK